MHRNKIGDSMKVFDKLNRVLLRLKRDPSSKDITREVGFLKKMLDKHGIRSKDKNTSKQNILH